jgi:ABC-type sugar transport system ATPase subunit
VATTEGPLLEMRGISKHFPGVRALDDVSLRVDAGQVLALVGENGAGKSTLIKILAGAQQPDAGEILIDGQRARIGSPADAERYGIVTVYQEFNLFPALSVAENLLFGQYPKNGPVIDWRACRAEARRFLAEMQVHLDPDRPAAELSIAEKQMLEIAKALHRSVRIMILDEPTAVLGGSDVDELMRVVRSLREHGVGVIFISHRLDEIFGLAERYVVLKDGRRVDAGVVAEVDHDHIVSKMVGREFDELPEHEGAETGADEVLRVENLTRRGELHDISLSLHKGEVVGIAGLRGAGRTELARAIFGADRIDSGRVFVNGRKVKIKSPRDAIRNGIGLVPEDRATQGLLKNLSTAQNIPLARLAAAARRLISPRRERRLANRYVGELNIRVADVAALVGMLSGGNQQKVVLAKWLEAHPSVLILDEPTRGIDVGSKREIYEIVRRLCDEGLGVVVISSELPEVLQISDRILVMHQGRIAAELDGADASEELVMSHAVGGNPEFN